MKKWTYGIIGAFVGVAMTISFSAAAEEFQSLIGKQVEGQVAVIVDGKEISVPAAIIEGTSYAPVRAVAEAVGRNVDWYEGKVLINSKEAVKTVEPSVTPTLSPVPQEEITLLRAQGEIDRLSTIVTTHKGLMLLYPDVEQYKTDYDKYKAELDYWEGEKAKLEGK